MHHMIDYIREEPVVLRRTLADGDDALDSIVQGVRDGRWKRIVVLGVGSSYTAALMALPAFRLVSPIPVEVLPSTELRHYAARWLGPETLVISVSRSGERGWVVDVQRDARTSGSFVAAMTGVRDSLLALEADLVVPTAEGSEITFSKTKSVVACAALLMKLAFRLAPETDMEAHRHLAQLERVPDLVERTIASLEPAIGPLVSELADIEHIYLCGSGTNCGAALEGAIKIHETSYIPTKAEDTGNCLHGVLGTTDPGWLVIVLAARQDVEVARAVLRLAGTMGARRLALSEPGLLHRGAAEFILETAGEVDPLIASLVFLPPLQLLTFRLTLARGKNPDAPAYMRAQLDAMLPAGREEPELRGANSGDNARTGTEGRAD